MHDIEYIIACSAAHSTISVARCTSLACSSPTYTMAISVNAWALAVLLLSTGVLASEFDYSNGPLGPANWGDLKPEWATCKTGTEQSPMEITAGNTVTDADLDSPLDGTFPILPTLLATITNKGETVEIALPAGYSTLKIDGAVYEAKQMHFHYPSEHKLPGFTFPLEMHLVHTRVEAGVTKIAVIGWLFRLGHENSFLNQFVNNLPKTLGQKKSILLLKLLSTRGPYGRYMGSLTTPPCSEGVIWTVMLNFQTVSQRQLDLFAEAFHPNARPVQPANGRQFAGTH